MNKTQTENLQLKNNSQMIKALKNVDWVLFGLNILAIRSIRRLFYDLAFISNFYYSNVDFWIFHAFKFVFPVSWCILWYIRSKYEKTELTLVRKLNGFFFILSILDFWLKNILFEV
jgi:hypothetical protein